MTNKNILNIVSGIKNISNDIVIYAKRINGKFTRNSEAVLLELTEEENEMLTSEIAQLKCPGYEYFLEAFIIKDFVEDSTIANSQVDIEQLTNRIIYYAEFDA